MYMRENTCVEFHGIDPYKEPPRPAGTNVVMIVGATATGKTELSLNLAGMIRDAYGTGSEIIAADKKTAHQETDTITATPTQEEQARTPHHMVGVFDPFDHWVPRWTYQAMARACIRDVSGRGQLPIAVGGSVHLMEALAYYPRHRSLGADTERQRLEELSLDDLREEALARGLAGPFEDDSRRWRNHIMARTALRRPWDQPPYHGTLLLGVRRDRETQRARIAARLDATYWQMVDELESLLLSGPALTPPQIGQTIGMGNFGVSSAMPEETPEEVYQRTKQSIFDQTIAFAEWQELEIRSWMEPHIRWVDSAEEALQLYDSHLRTLP
jgi:tRNA A37 N6-isopentenylltransferase MiaA